jgi:hypothetical protein
MNDAEQRAWEVVRRAFEERPPARRRSRASNTVVLAAVLAALVTATVGAAASSPGQAVIDHVRRVVGISNADEALFSLPAPGRLLIVSGDGGGVWLAHDNGYKRKLGPYRDAEWSPHGLYVVATTANHLLALDLEHGVRWTLARRDPTWPRWEGTRTDTRIAYLTHGGLRVVAGDGTGDKLLDRYAGDVPPAWDPARLHTVAYYSGGAIVLRQADSGKVVWRAPIDVLPSALQWSDDGRYLAVTASPKSVVLDDAGRLRKSVSMLGSELTETAFKPHTHLLAVSLRLAQRSQVRLVDLEHPGHATLLFAGPGDFGDIAWSPNGRWLLLNWPTANQWLFVSGSKVHAVGNIAQEFPRNDKLGPLLQVADRWCCS